MVQYHVWRELDGRSGREVVMLMVGGYPLYRWKEDSDSDSWRRWMWKWVVGNEKDETLTNATIPLALIYPPPFSSSLGSHSSSPYDDKTEDTLPLPRFSYSTTHTYSTFPLHHSPNSSHLLSSPIDVVLPGSYLDGSVTPEWFPEADATALGWWVRRERWRVPMRVRVAEKNLNEAEDRVEKKEGRRRKVVEVWADSGWWDEDEAEVCLRFLTIRSFF
jgi:hypothetical protein